LNFREKLAAVLPEHSHKLIFYARGAKHPPYNEEDVTGSLKLFCSEILPKCPLVDPRKKQIKLIKSNFPKLADLEHKTLSREEFTASDIVSSIENGSFALDDYRDMRQERLKCLLWLPEVICDPDAIYRNAHKIVAGDEVYVRVYDKMGSKVKLAFTMDIRDKKDKRRVIRTVIVTSFLTDPATAISYVKGDPVYLRPEQKNQPPESG
jgi:hypothetical protein